ncbi:hypothetical protein [Candidatus Poriferisodalis sp.]|uniref:hypothetical protein n=1 Tax=Candidatus Poriferisodalis sp. TaxID=3101277 RepID=UPI003B528EB5
MKRWYMVAWAALIAFALSSSQSSARSAWLIAVLPVAMGASAWLLDSFYLREERRFRALYDFARKKDRTTFSMKPRPAAGSDTWRKTVFSWSLWPFYAPLIALHVVVVIS